MERILLKYNVQRKDRRYDAGRIKLNEVNSMCRTIDSRYDEFKSDAIGYKSTTMNFV